VPVINGLFYRSPFLQNFPGLFMVVPEIIGSGKMIEFLKSLYLFSQVKDNLLIRQFSFQDLQYYFLYPIS